MTAGSAPKVDVPLHIGGVDMARGVVVNEDGTTVRLTSTQRQLLLYFLEHPSQDLTRERLLAEVFGYGAGAQTRSLDTAVKELRAKLERDRKAPDHILTVWGVGYRFEPLSQAPASLGFVGRTAELAWCRQALRRPKPILLTGMAGVGKSRLALEATRGEPAVHVYLDGLVAADGVVASIVSALPPSDLPTPARVARLGAPLVIHDAEGFPAVVSRWVWACLAGAPDARILVTSRGELEGDWQQLPLEPLDNAELVEIVRNVMGPAGATWSAEQLELLVQRLDGLPLAAELIGAWSDVLGPEAILVRVESLLTQHHPSAGSLDKVLARSIAALTDRHRRVLTVCILFRGPFQAEDLVAVLDREALVDLAVLRRASLIQRSGAGLLHVLPLLRAALSVLLSPRRQDLERFVDLVFQRVDEEPSMRWFPALRALVDEDGPVEQTLRAGLAMVATTRGHRAEGVPGPVLQRLRSLLPRCDDAVLVARVWLGLVQVASRGGLAERCDLDEAIAAARRAGEEGLELRARLLLVQHLRLGSDVGSADAALDDLLPRVLGGSNLDPGYVAQLWSELALIRRHQGRMDDAVTALGRALAQFRTEGPSSERCAILHRLGQTHAESGRFAAAMAWWERAADDADAVGLLWGAHQIALSRALAAIEAGEVPHPELPTAPPWTEGPHHHAVKNAFLTFAALESGEVSAAGRYVGLALDAADRRMGVFWGLARLADGLWRLWVGDPEAGQAFAEVGELDEEPLRSWGRVWAHVATGCALQGVHVDHPMVEPMLQALAVAPGPRPAFGIQARLLFDHLHQRA